LYDRMMDWLFAAGAERVWLTTDAGTRAERFYRAASWRSVGAALPREARYEYSRHDWLAIGELRAVRTMSTGTLRARMPALERRVP
jgi:hypothetical protein